jgi:hypothetical protein
MSEPHPGVRESEDTSGMSSEVGWEDSVSSGHWAGCTSVCMSTTSSEKAGNGDAEEETDAPVLMEGNVGESGEDRAEDDIEAVSEDTVGVDVHVIETGCEFVVESAEGLASVGETRQGADDEVCDVT